MADTPDVTARRNWRRRKDSSEVRHEVRHETVREVAHTDPAIIRRIEVLEARCATMDRPSVVTHVSGDTRLIRLALWAIEAVRAEHAGAPYNDFRWHGGTTDFVWEGTRYDAPSFLEFAQAELARIETSGSK